MTGNTGTLAEGPAEGGFPVQKRRGHGMCHTASWWCRSAFLVSLDIHICFLPPVFSLAFSSVSSFVFPHLFQRFLQACAIHFDHETPIWRAHRTRAEPLADLSLLEIHPTPHFLAYARALGRARGGLAQELLIVRLLNSNDECGQRQSWAPGPWMVSLHRQRGDDDRVRSLRDSQNSDSAIEKNHGYR